jgi:hypothetical protein
VKYDSTIFEFDEPWIHNASARLAKKKPRVHTIDVKRDLINSTHKKPNSTVDIVNRNRLVVIRPLPPLRFASATVRFEFRFCSSRDGYKTGGVET